MKRVPIDESLDYQLMQIQRAYYLAYGKHISKTVASKILAEGRSEINYLKRFL